MLIRLVHSQNTSGALLVTDIDSGLPNEEFGLQRKQPVYLNHFKTYFGGDGKVAVDRTLPGYIDLVPSDKVKLSVDRGVIKGLADNSFLSVIQIPTGAAGAPTLSAATFDSSTIVAGADDGLVTLTGTLLASYAPDTTSITLTHSLGTITLASDAVGVTASATSITVTAAAHGFGTTTLISFVASVTSNGQTATLAITEV